jgi:hypothetical protein
MFMPHPSMSSEELRERTQGVWDRFYSLRSIWERSYCAPNPRARLTFLFVSKPYRQMYAGTGISTDSARQSRARFWASLLAKPTRRLFQGKSMPELGLPGHIGPQAGALEYSSTAARRDDCGISLHVLR